MDQAVREWAPGEVKRHRGVIKVGYFGSYARGDWGVGSDLDLVVVVDHSDEPFERRAARWSLNSLPVPAELLVYTLDEWHRLLEQGGRFARTLAQETIWVDARTAEACQEP